MSYVRQIISQRSPMQTKKPQPSGQRIMPETEFPASSVYPRVGNSLSASETNDSFYFSFQFGAFVPLMCECMFFFFFFFVCLIGGESF